jgi:carboxyl-terminal processing protease
MLGVAAACHRGTSPAAAMAPTAAAACVAPVASGTASLAGTAITDPLVTFDTAWAIIARTHWDTTYNGVDWRGVRDELRPRAAAAKTTGELRSVLSDMVGRLKQSHFSIIPREVSDATSGSGAPTVDQNGTTGATLRFVEGAIVVTEVPAASAAGRAGVRQGWQLEAVQGCPVATRLARIPRDLDPRRAAFMAFSLANQMLAGPVGSRCARPFDGSGRPHVVDIARSRAGNAREIRQPPVPRVAHPRTRGAARRSASSGSTSDAELPQFDAAVDPCATPTRSS